MRTATVCSRSPSPPADGWQLLRLGVARLLRALLGHVALFHEGPPLEFPAVDRRHRLEAQVAPVVRRQRRQSVRPPVEVDCEDELLPLVGRCGGCGGCSDGRCAGRGGARGGVGQQSRICRLLIHPPSRRQPPLKQRLALALELLHLTLELLAQVLLPEEVLLRQVRRPPARLRNLQLDLCSRLRVSRTSRCCSSESTRTSSYVCAYSCSFRADASSSSCCSRPSAFSTFRLALTASDQSARAASIARQADGRKDRAQAGRQLFTLTPPSARGERIAPETLSCVKSAARGSGARSPVHCQVVVVVVLGPRGHSTTRRAQRGRRYVIGGSSYHFGETRAQGEFTHAANRHRRRARTLERHVERPLQPLPRSPRRGIIASRTPSASWRMARSAGGWQR